MGSSASSDQSQPLFIRTLTWHKESHQLFDYNSNNYICENFQAHDNGFIAKLNQSISYTAELKEGQEALLVLSQPCSSQVKVKPVCTDSIDGAWFVVKQGQSLPVQQGDYIKLGRVQFRIKEINLNNKQPSTMTTADIERSSEMLAEDLEDSKLALNLDRSSHSSQMHGQLRCRICFGKEATDDDPLLTPCNCAGSLQYAHLACLKMWLAQKMQKQITPRSYCYKWNQSKCEVCQQTYRQHYDQNGRSYELYRFDVPSEPHLVLEGSKLKGGEQKRVTFVCLLENGKDIKIGRDHESEVRTNDVSVSRKHCSLLFRNGQLFLQDNKSKFGTLVRFQRRISVSSNELWMQYGRTLVVLSKESYLTSACCMCIEEVQFEIEGEDAKNKSLSRTREPI